MKGSGHNFAIPSPLKHVGPFYLSNWARPCLHNTDFQSGKTNAATTFLHGRQS